MLARLEERMDTAAAVSEIQHCQPYSHKKSWVKSLKEFKVKKNIDTFPWQGLQTFLSAFPQPPEALEKKL